MSDILLSLLLFAAILKSGVGVCTRSRRQHRDNTQDNHYLKVNKVDIGRRRKRKKKDEENEETNNHQTGIYIRFCLFGLSFEDGAVYCLSTEN